MTDKARELLERTAEILELLFEGPNDVDPNTLAMLGDTRLEEIRAYLAEPEQDEEPVAWMKEDEDGDLEFNTLNQFSRGRTNGIPLYLHPAPRPKFVRLSEEEVNSLTYAPYEPYELICAVENRLVEKNRDR